MKLIIKDEVRKKYPDLRIAVVIANLLNNNETEEIDSKVSLKFNNFINDISNIDNLLDKDNIKEWREIYKSFGINPKKKKPSAEALLSRIIKGNYIPHINPAVDAYLIAETIHFLPIGGYDLGKIDGDIYLTISNGNEEFIPISNDKTEITKQDEVIYKDSARILTRCWNYKDCCYSQISEDTKKIALFIEAPTKNISTNMIIETAEEIEENLKQFCNADTEIKFISENLNEIEIKK